jgi:hypothetical protein
MGISAHTAMLQVLQQVSLASRALRFIRDNETLLHNTGVAQSTCPEELVGGSEPRHTRESDSVLHSKCVAGSSCPEELGGGAEPRCQVYMQHLYKTAAQHSNNMMVPRCWLVSHPMSISMG